MADDLVSFLRERLDEDEATAKGARGPAWVSAVEREGSPGHWRGVKSWQVALPSPDDTLFVGDVIASCERRQDEDHIARHDPARVLREVEAKRRIVELHFRIERWVSWMEYDDGDHAESGERLTVCGLCVPRNEWFDSRADVREWPCPTVLALTLPYSDHPDYREEWSPTEVSGG